MSAPPRISGLTGKAETNLLNSIPTASFQAEDWGYTKKYASEPIAPKLLPKNIDYSTRDNVLPCKGITHHVLRAEPPPASAGMVAPTGISRHQPRGLAQEKPTNLPLMPFSNPFDSSKNNPLGRPK